MTIKIISFDFDGTLVFQSFTTESAYFNALDGQISLDELRTKFQLFEQEYLNSQPDLRKAFRSFGKLSNDEAQKLYYRWNNERLKFILPKAQESERLKILQKINDSLSLTDKPVLFPDVIDNIKYFKKLGLSLNILSGNKLQFIKDSLVVNNLDGYFDEILTPDSLQMNKDELFTYYTSKNINLREILHLGDEPELDYHVPKGLGLNALWLKRPKGRYLDSSIPETDKISNLDELKNKIENL